MPQSGTVVSHYRHYKEKKEKVKQTHKIDPFCNIRAAVAQFQIMHGFITFCSIAVINL